MLKHVDVSSCVKSCDAYMIHPLWQWYHQHFLLIFNFSIWPNYCLFYCLCRARSYEYKCQKQPTFGDLNQWGIGSQWVINGCQLIFWSALVRHLANTVQKNQIVKLPPCYIFLLTISDSLNKLSNNMFLSMVQNIAKTGGRQLILPAMCGLEFWDHMRHRVVAPYVHQ